MGLESYRTIARRTRHSVVDEIAWTEASMRRRSMHVREGQGHGEKRPAVDAGCGGIPACTEYQTRTLPNSALCCRAVVSHWREPRGNGIGEPRNPVTHRASSTVRLPDAMPRSCCAR